MIKYNTVYFGTPDFSIPTLELLMNHPHINLKYVVTMPDRPAGRGQQIKKTAIATFANQNKLNLFQTDNINKEDQFLKSLKSENIDLFIVLAFGQFLKRDVLDIPQKGSFNIHTSLLPKYRGAAPIQHALLNGEKETGVSIQRMEMKMDAGDLVLSYPVEISPKENYGLLYTRLKYLSAICANNFIDQLIKEKVTYTKQDDKKVSFAPSIKKEDGFLDFRNSNAEKILNQIRAFDPWPGTYCFLDDKRLKIISAITDPIKLSPGEISLKYNTLLIGCLNGSLRLTECQLEGKKTSCDSSLLNGLINKKKDFKINPQ